MEREFLENLRVGEQALSDEVMDAILQQHEKELSSLRLHSAVETAISKAGGRNLKAITALLDMDTISGAEDVAGELEKAIGQLKKDSGYLFEETTPPPYAALAGAAQPRSPQTPKTLAGALRERMRK